VTAALKASAALSVLSLLLCASAATAQETAAPPTPAPTGVPAKDNAPTLGDIVVTARKQGAENVQNVPSSIQVLGEQTLQRQQASGFNDYFRQVPSLAAINQGPGQTQIIMRGVTTGRVTHAQPQNKSTTGLYIDDIPVSSGAFNPDLGLFDVSRIEVLRGPQGTLYGAGAMSGAIRIITNEPDTRKFAALLDGTLAGVTDGGTDYSAKGMVNVPVSDTFAIRATGYYTRDAGFIDNIVRNQSDYNSDKVYGGRVAAKWQPTDRLTLKANLIYQKLKSKGRPSEFEPGDPAVSAVAAPGEDTTITDQRQVVKFVPDPFNDRMIIANGVIDYDFGQFELTSSTSYFNRKYLNQLDDTYRVRGKLGPTEVDGVTPLIAPFDNHDRMHMWVNETRIATKGTGPLTGVVGIYAFYQRETFDQDEIVPGLDALTESYGLGNAARFGAQPNSIFDGTQDIKQHQLAGFGELTWKITDKLSVLGGVRVFHFKQGFDLHYAGLANDGVTAKNEMTKENGVNPKAEVTYKAARDLLFYATAAKGFRLGGVNEPVPLSGVFGTNCGADLASRGLTGLPDTFKSDTLWNYEVGMKSKFANRLTFNASVYQIDWKNIQTSAFLPCGFATVVNAGDVRSRGVELETAFAVTRSLTLNFGGSFTDAKLTKTTLAFDAQPGDRVPNVPRWLLTGSFNYERPLNDADTMFLRGDIQYSSNAYSDFRSVSSARLIPRSASGNLYLGFRRNPWEISIFAKNVSDSRVVIGVNNDRNTPDLYTLARPRTIGINLRWRYN
jgi:iron complex outermembrane recepter protein